MDKQCTVMLKNICVKFNHQNPILDDLNLKLSDGEILSILGPGGCGKSTLLKVILGIVPMNDGEIHLFGENLTTTSFATRDLLRKRIGMAFQQGALFDFLTVKENILFAIKNMTSMDVEQADERVKTLLSQVGLPDAGDKYPKELSGGMKRRVGIVRAMATNSKLVMLDEPTAGLDPVTTTIVLDMIRRIGDPLGSTMLCVTSSVEVAFRFSKNVAVLKDGKIIGQGTKEELIQKQNPWLTNFLTIRDTLTSS